MLVLGLETSCDETGVALYDTAPPGLLAHALHTQILMHRDYGGVVPELASRDHIRRVVPLLREALERAGKSWSAEEEAAFRQPVMEQFERQGHPLYASARLWDDGIIEPWKTREVLALSLSAALNAPVGDTRFGLFRM